MSELETTKQENKERSLEQGELVYVGTLSEILGTENFEGSVSLAERLEAGEITQTEVDQAVKLLAGAYVDSKPGACWRCVDGRCICGYDDNNPEHYNAPLGSQQQGASIDEAVANRLDKGYESGANLLTDTRELCQSEGEYKPGSHDDDHSPEGCGAVKGQEKKLEYYQDPAKFDAIKAGVFAIAELGGVQLPADAVDHLPENARILSENIEDYFGDKVKAVNAVTEYSPEGKVTLQNKHNECILAINFVKGTTLHTGHYNALTGEKIEAFGLDGWALNSPTMIADALATVMNLTDGSIKVYVRKPLERAAA